MARKLEIDRLWEAARRAEPIDAAAKLSDVKAAARRLQRAKAALKAAGEGPSRPEACAHRWRLSNGIQFLGAMETVKALSARLPQRPQRGLRSRSRSLVYGGRPCPGSLAATCVRLPHAPQVATITCQARRSQRTAVVVNHFKSKGCGDASGVNADQGAGQGCWNALRVEEAEALLAFIDEIQAQTGVEEVLVLGDLNAYGEEDPIDALRAGGLVDLLAQHVPEERRYSYVHDAQAGYLDHALATPALADKVTGATEWHINADEAGALDYRDDNLAGLFSP